MADITHFIILNDQGDIEDTLVRDPKMNFSKAFDHAREKVKADGLPRWVVSVAAGDKWFSATKVWSAKTGSGRTSSRNYHVSLVPRISED